MLYIVINECRCVMLPHTQNLVQHDSVGFRIYPKCAKTHLRASVNLNLKNFVGEYPWISLNKREGDDRSEG
jgi:hypothetical protein